MSDWRSRCEINGDVCFFSYVSPEMEKKLDEVYIWDLDKTYLDTKIDSLFSLLRTFWERAFNKKNIPGTSTLLSMLASYHKKKYQQKNFPIYFITATPPQMEERISEKFYLDDIRPFGCFYKNNFANLSPQRLKRLVQQVGFKVQALMQLRQRMPENIQQICWGDDSESDAIIYNLYSDICARRLGALDIRFILEKLNVSSEQIDLILHLQSLIPISDPVQKIYINLATDTDPEYYLKFGRRTCPTYNTFQVALDLVQDQRLDLQGLENVIQDMIYNYSFTTEELMKSFDEMIRRGVIGEKTFYILKEFFLDKGLLYPDYSFSSKPLKEKTVQNGVVFEMEGEHEPWVHQHIDYIRDYR